MKRFIQLVCCAAILISTASPSSHAHWPLRQRPLVQMAILLDTSNSMDGLIEQAKSQLWRIANDLAYSTQYGQRPTLEVALYEYGNNGLSRGENFVRQVLPFTTDLDEVSQHLFALRTNGGEEYCGAVIKDSLNGLAWNPRKDVYKVIFIAGNEPFTQGPVYFRDAIQQAVRKDIIVNPIFCGRHQEGVQTQWYAGAITGRGAYMNIDSNLAVVVDPTPYDGEISRLGNQINETYVAYGDIGRKSLRSRANADLAAAKNAPAAAPVERSLFKATPQYSAQAGDVVSEVASGRLEVAGIKPADLPIELQGKSETELKGYLKEQNDKRVQIQSRLSGLKKSREDFLAAKQREKNVGGAMSLDQAVLKAVRDQAQKLHFAF